MGNLKVFGGPAYLNGAQRRTVVAVPSKAALQRLLGLSRSEMDGYWCETGNKDELEQCLLWPGEVFQWYGHHLLWVERKPNRQTGGWRYGQGKEVS